MPTLTAVRFELVANKQKNTASQPARQKNAKSNLFKLLVPLLRRVKRILKNIGGKLLDTRGFKFVANGNNVGAWMISGSIIILKGF
jgi:hypothetical protein